jgi:hypothetical protein
MQQCDAAEVDYSAHDRRSDTSRMLAAGVADQQTRGAHAVNWYLSLDNDCSL